MAEIVMKARRDDTSIGDDRGLFLSKPSCHPKWHLGVAAALILKAQ